VGLGLKRDSEGDSEGRGDRESASASLVSVRPLCNVLRAYVKLVRLLCVTHERTHLCQDSVSSPVSVTTSSLEPKPVTPSLYDPTTIPTKPVNPRSPECADTKDSGVVRISNGAHFTSVVVVEEDVCESVFT
jgi:hypothetical protein